MLWMAIYLCLFDLPRTIQQVGNILSTIHAEVAFATRPTHGQRLLSILNTGDFTGQKEYLSPQFASNDSISRRAIMKYRFATSGTYRRDEWMLNDRPKEMETDHPCPCA